jgi:mannobiose 2-epimerase
MDHEARKALSTARQELLTTLRDGILPFWAERALDERHGGYLTDFDGNGELRPGRHDKYLNTQARLVWCFSELSEVASNPAPLLDLAAKGMEFLRARLLDPEHGGWHWKVARDGGVVDPAKLIYGESFALYGVAAFARRTGDPEARRLAIESFDRIHAAAADTLHGGYFENLRADWTPAGAGAEAGDRKSLDSHMHLLESFTELVRLTGSEIHRRRLRAVRTLIVERMIDLETGAGGNQYDLEFRPLLPIVIPKTWIAERNAEEGVEPEASDVVTTCYGHNLELGWLLGAADGALGEAGASDAVIASLARHALAHGNDPECGGVYREGPPGGTASDTDKEFWQNAESLVGWLEAYRVSRHPAYLDAFLGTWRFARDHLVHPRFGEWRVRTDREGRMLDDDLGNPWKVAYHTGRGALESIRRLDALLAEDGENQGVERGTP